MKSYTIPIVGARFRPPADAVLQLLPANAPLKMHRQPENPYDENAIQLMLPDWVKTYPQIVEHPDVSKHYDEENQPPVDLHLGYIPKDFAAKIAPVMDIDVGTDLTTPDWEGTLGFTSSGGPAVIFSAPDKEVPKTEIRERAEDPGTQ